jgi:hypothetical protein
MFAGTRTSVFVALVLATLLFAQQPPLFAQQAPIVPRDAVIRLVLNDHLSTKESDVGDRFSATVAEDVSVNGRVLVRHGATVQGTVTEVERAKRLAGITGKAKIMLRFDRIQTTDGWRPLAATLISVHDAVDDEEAKVGDEGEVKEKTDTKDIITKGAIGVAAGAVLGALFGNVSRGVVLGSIGGAVAILAPKGKDVTLEKGMGLRIRLDRDLNLGTT